jgi:hypothetical protein
MENLGFYKEYLGQPTDKLFRDFQGGIEYYCIKGWCPNSLVAIKAFKTISTSLIYPILVNSWGRICMGQNGSKRHPFGLSLHPIKSNGTREVGLFENQISKKCLARKRGKVVSLAHFVIFILPLSASSK